MEISSVVEKQREYFSNGMTLSYESRIANLNKLEISLRENEHRFYQASYLDLGKSEMETYMCELGLVYAELKWMRKNLKKLMKNKKVKTPMVQMLAKSYITPVPYGNVLIMSPWNYPILLTLEPLIDAIAAGNTAIVKPSEYAPNISNLILEIVTNTFSSEFVTVVLGGKDTNTKLLEERFDKIFFTGSVAVGKIVMQSASKYLTPVTLELGGKSPCIIDKTAKLDLAARRIVFGKFLNSGQTCVAPDYIICDKEIETELIKHLINEIKKQYGDAPLTNKLYGKIINQKHFERLIELIDDSKVAYGGQIDNQLLKIEPTILKNVLVNDKIMENEIFGPILPIITYNNLDEAIAFINSKPKPLSLYCFTNSEATKEIILSKCRFGGGCFNDTIIHLVNNNLPFGGVGESGMGSYHGKAGFEAFTHYRAIVDKSNLVDPSVRYQPYNKKKFSFIKKVL